MGLWASQVVVVVKDLPDEGSVRGSGRSPGGGHGNPLLAWRIPWTEDPGGLQSMGPEESDN